MKTNNSQDEPEEGVYPRVESLLEFVTDTIAYNEKNNIYNLSLRKVKDELEVIKKLLVLGH